MIYLIRHASPLVNYGRCGGVLAKVLLDEYNQTSNIKEDEIEGFLSRPELCEALLVSEADILSSPVNRAYTTACRMFKATRIQQDSRLQEYDLQLRAIPFLRMGLRQWFALHRILWMLGVSLGAVSRKIEYLRAASVANDLYMSFTDTGKTKIVISHGMFLRTVRKTLQKKGMQAYVIYRSGCFTVESLTP